MAGNLNSGNVIPFRMSEAELQKKIELFRKHFAGGSNGMVTWPRFCAFLGYSEAIVAECYWKGKEGKNAYTGRSELLEAFRTECKALTMATCSRQQQLARDECRCDYFRLEGDSTGDGVLIVKFGCPGDDRWIQAMK